MANLDLSLKDVFKQVFGYETTAFNPTFSKVTGNDITDLDRKEFGAVAGSAYYNDDPVTGREYFLPVIINYPVDITATSTFGSSQASTLKSWALPNPVISITSRKHIVETALTERRGTVKEIINTEDYTINIKGFIIAATNEFPEEDVTTLRDLYESNVGVSIQNPVTDIFLLRPDRSGSDNVVITELRFPEVTGIKNIRPYELTMVSDEPFNLVDIK